MELNESNVRNEESHLLQEMKVDKDVDDDSTIAHVNVQSTVTVIESEQINICSSTVDTQNGGLDVRNGSSSRKHTMDVSSISGVKRARMTLDEEQPSVHVVYNSLTRASREKLEEALQQWSEWQAQHGSSLNDANEVIESGEKTYFPALRVGKEKGSAVSFWIDNQTRNQNDNGFITLDSNSTPLYDRGYALGLTIGDSSSNMDGGLEIIEDASRCFNCGSYSHSLKECLKPRDSAAVNNARKQLKAKRNQNSGSRNPTRYYQNSAGGKYDGLRPGALDAETRKLLGLGELDPPPWLNRMRELGYPPGYLGIDNEDLPSGITIYADVEIKEDEEIKEDGEIFEMDRPEPQRKFNKIMTVDFPGINAPIPENANDRLWATRPPNPDVYRPQNPDVYRERSHHRSNHYQEPISRGPSREQRWSRDSRDDGPPGCDAAVLSMSMSSYPPRYGGYDSSYNSQSRTPTLGRSLSERSRWSPSGHEDYMSHGSLNSSHLYSNRRMSPPDHGLARYESDGHRVDHPYHHRSRW